jgi:glycosyltransferase involved in cell wall biosynthesis
VRFDVVRSGHADLFVLSIRAAQRESLVRSYGSLKLMAPKVSCIVIVYNGEKFLAEAIASVLAQSLVDWELLVVDDGSTDTSYQIAQRFAQTSPDKIRSLRHADGQNHGMSATRNLGLSHASGEYIAFLDADDVWLPNKLASQVAILDAQPSVGATYGRALIWYSWAGENAKETDFFYELGVRPDQVYHPPTLLLSQLLNVYQSPTSTGCLLRRTLVNEVGGFEPAFRGMFEDAVFFAKALLMAPFFVSGEVLFKYRQHSSSAGAVSAAANRDAWARLRFLTWFKKFLRKTAADPRVFKLVRSLIRKQLRLLASQTLKAIFGKQKAILRRLMPS